MTPPSSAPPIVPLDERLCVALYTASRAMTASYRPLLGELGLTYPQYLVLVLLWEDGDCTVSQIGRRLSLESSTLSPLLKRLEAMGLLERTRSARDERSVLVTLTPNGREMQTRAAAVPDEICSAIGLAPTALTALVDELRRLTRRLGATAER